MTHIMFAVEAWPHVHQRYREYLRSKVYKSKTNGIWNLITREVKFYNIHVPEDIKNEVLKDLANDSCEETVATNRIAKMLKPFIPKFQAIDTNILKNSKREKGFSCHPNWANILFMCEYHDDYWSEELNEGKRKTNFIDKIKTKITNIIGKNVFKLQEGL